MADVRNFYRMAPDGKAVRICPRCGKDLEGHPALSRIANMNICSQCGTDEAMEDFFDMRCMPVEAWFISAYAEEMDDWGILN